MFDTNNQTNNQGIVSLSLTSKTQEYLGLNLNET